MLAALLLAACSDDTPDTSAEAQEIRFRADVWQVMEGTRATTIDNAAALQAESFKCYAYVDGTTDRYIDGATVSYSSATDPNWTFDDGKHYWPASGALNFFVHLPATLPSYCTFDPTAYDAESNDDGYSEYCPRLTCTGLPVSLTAGSDATKELVYAYTANQSKAGQGSSGVALTFKHPFARVKFKLSETSGSNVVVNSVTFNDENGNRCLDSHERAYIILDIINEGRSDVYEIAPTITCDNRRIVISPTAIISQLPGGRTARYKAAVTSRGRLKNGMTNFRVSFDGGRTTARAFSIRTGR